MTWLAALLVIITGILRSRAALQIENLALRHQLGVDRRKCRRPRIRSRDRVFWAWLSRTWSGWRESLVIVQPETVIAWRRRRFREYWARLSRSGKPGRPTVAREVRALMRRVAREQVVTAILARQGPPRPPQEPPTPRVVEHLSTALECQALLESGEVPTQAAIARRKGVTRARVTQVMSLHRLTPEIRARILSLPESTHGPAVSERALRTIAQLEDVTRQKIELRQLLRQSIQEPSPGTRLRSA